MLSKRLRRYPSLLALMGALVGFIILTLTVNIYVSSSVLPVVNMGALRSQSLQGLIRTLGVQNKDLHKEVLEHVVTIRDGGDLITQFGEIYQVQPSFDSAIIRSANKVEALMRQGSIEGVEDAYNEFVSSYHNFRMRREGYFQVFQIMAAVAVLVGLFGILLTLFLRLGRSDDLAEEGVAENQRILATINDGLFYLGPDFQIGSVQSAATQAIFARQYPISGDFYEFLGSMMSEEIVASVREYLKRLATSRGDYTHLDALNPLTQIEVNLSSGRADLLIKHLRFDFIRGEDIVDGNLLVSVRDVSREIALSKELDGVSTQEIQADEVDINVNSSLAIQADAAPSSLEKTEPARTLEQDDPALVRSAGSAESNDLTEAVVAKPSEQSTPEVKEVTINDYLAEDPSLSQLQKSALELAERHSKSINLDVSGIDDIAFKGAFAADIEAVCTHLVQNAVVHGIEDSEFRQSINKASTGQIVVTLRDNGTESMNLMVRDDGAGLNLKDIRAKAVRKGLVSFDNAAKLKAADIVLFLFKPGFRTQTQPDEGECSGLDAVKSTITGMNGKIGVKSRKGRFCEFTIKLPKSLVANQ